VEDTRHQTRRCKRFELRVFLVAVGVISGDESFDGGVLIERVGGVGSGACRRDACATGEAVADAVIFVGAVGGVVAVIGGNELAEGIVRPCGAIGGSATAGGVASLADGVHCITDVTDDAIITSAGVGFCQ